MKRGYGISVSVDINHEARIQAGSAPAYLRCGISCSRAESEEEAVVFAYMSLVEPRLHHILGALSLKTPPDAHYGQEFRLTSILDGIKQITTQEFSGGLDEDVWMYETADIAIYFRMNETHPEDD